MVISRVSRQLDVLANVVDDLLSEGGAVMFRIVNILVVVTVWIDNQLSHRIDVSDTAACPRGVLGIDQEDGLLAVGQEVVHSSDTPNGCR